MTDQPAENQHDPELQESEQDKDFTEMREVPLLFGKAFIIGAADVVPGVSGGTMGLILGIYKRMIDAIKSVNGVAVRSLLTFNLKGVFAQVHWKFGLTLILGIFTALLFFTRIVPLPVYMYSHPELIYGLFFGLILGSVVLLTLDLGRFSLRAFISMLTGTVAGYIIVTLVPTETPDHPLFLLLTGSIAITALILPGVSGSFLLLIMRKYDTILGAIGQLGTPQTMDAIMILIPFGIGVVAGLAVFSRILSWLLDRYYLVTLCLLIGFMAGSLYIIWPFQDREFIQSERPQIVNVSSPLVAMAAESTPSERVPEFLVLGDILNPEAPESEQMVEVIVVKNALISSTPFIPSTDTADADQRLSAGKASVHHGYIMMLIGILAVLMLGYISRTKASKRPGRS